MADVFTQEWTHEEWVKMGYKDRIVSNPDVMLGKPTIKGTRITVELILNKLSEKMTLSELLEAFPQLVEQDVNATLAHSADVFAEYSRSHALRASLKRRSTSVSETELRH